MVYKNYLYMLSARNSVFSHLSVALTFYIYSMKMAISLGLLPVSDSSFPLWPGARSGNQGTQCGDHGTWCGDHSARYSNHCTRCCISGNCNICECHTCWRWQRCIGLTELLILMNCDMGIFSRPEKYLYKRI